MLQIVRTYLRNMQGNLEAVQRAKGSDLEKGEAVVTLDMVMREEIEEVFGASRRMTGEVRWG